MDELAIVVRGVTKHFGKGQSRVQVLKEVDFHTYVGELLMIVGPSGSGKTTLISIISGTLRPDAGKVEVFNNDIEKMSEDGIAEFRKKNVGFIFQQFNLIPTLSILENVSIPMLLNKFSKKNAEMHAASWLEKVGLKGRERELPRNLSGGQQQRVAIARALVHEPRLVVCDEPTSALDAENGEIVMEILSELTKQPGRCGIIVTHDPRIFKFADRVVKMDDGIVLDTGFDNL